jgi:dTDP-4-dehydrorhamnose 3,5-epimerase
MDPPVAQPPSYPVVERFLDSCTLHQLEVRGDQRGALVAVEADQLGMAIARTYYMFNTLPGASRGFHAHRTLRQFVVPVSGSCQMILDNGTERVSLNLDRPDRGLFIPPLVWHEMHDLSRDAVLLVLADAPYEESDYLRDYPAFIREIGGQEP